MSDNSSTQSYKNIIFSINLDVSFVKSILDSVMAAYNREDLPSILLLRNIIGEHIVIPGFRRGKVHKAHPNQIRQAILNNFNQQMIKRTIIDVWGELNPGPVNRLVVWLRQHQDVFRDLCRPQNQAGEDESDHVISDETIPAELKKEFSDITNQEELKVAMFLALVQLIDSDDIGSGENHSVSSLGESHSREQIGSAIPAWEDICRQISEIPAEDERWFQIEVILERIRVIASEKENERAMKNRWRELEELWLKQQLFISKWSKYFEVSEAGNWSLPKFSLANPDVIISPLHKLVELLEIFDQINQRPAPQTRAERTRVDMERHQVENTILELYQTIDGYLTPEVVEVSTVASVSSDLSPAFTEDDQSKAISQEESNKYEKSPEESEEVVNEPPPMEATNPRPEVESLKTMEENIAEDTFFDVAVETKGLSDEEIIIDIDDETEEMGARLEENEIAQIPVEIDVAPEHGSNEFSETAFIADEPNIGRNVASDGISTSSSEIQTVNDNTVFQVATPQQDETKQKNETGIIDSLEQTAIEIVALSDKVILPLSQSNTTLVRFLERHELGAAFWVAWAMDQTGEESFVPSWLLAAAQSAIWSIALWPEQLGDLHESVCNLVKPETRLEQLTGQPKTWLKVACGIYYTLIMPNQGWEKWLEGQSLSSASNLSRLINLVLDFHNKGLKYDSALIQVILNAEETDRILEELSGQAKQWLAQSGNRTTRMHRANLLWQELVRPGQGDLYLLVEPVASNRQAKAIEISQQVEKWKDRPWLEKKIQKMDQDLRMRNEFSIIGEARLHLINWILEICEIVERWSGIVLHQDDLTKDGGWIYDQTREMCNSARERIDSARLEISRLREIETHPDVKASMNITAWIIEGIDALMDKDAQFKLTTWPKPVYINDSVDRSSPNFIIRCLAQQLSFHFELELDDEGLPNSDQAERVLSTLSQSQKRSPEDALQGWLERRDYRFIDQLLEEISDAEVWIGRCREAFHADLHWLEHTEIYNTDGEVEHAKLDELITELEYVDYKSRIESVQKIRRLADWDTNRQISFGSLARRLKSIQKEITQKRQVKIDHLQERWNKIRYQVLRLIGDDQAFYEKIKSSVESSLENQAISLAEDYLAHLQDAVNNGKTPPRLLFEGKRAGEEDILFDFQNLLPGYVDLFDPRGRKFSLQSLADSIKSDEPLPGIPHISPSAIKRGEAHKAIEAWQLLKKYGPEHDQAQNEYVKTILSYLGFLLMPEPTVTRGKSVGTMPNFLHWHIKMGAGDSAPVAAFGSQRNLEYEVIGVWQKPGIEAITSQVNALMQQTANQPAILFYFNYFTPARRDQLLGAAHREGLPMLVIDEPLLLYLARINDSRLKPMFYCTLPYAVIDPFFPFVRGKVPPEAFKGRRDLVRQLMDPAGPVIVYGGRQLGKSALLRQVESEFDRHEENRFAIYIDIKSIGDPASGKNYQRDFCDSLAKELTATTPKLIEDRRSYDIDRLVAQLQEQITSKNRKVILLLDEADHFLDADAEKNFYVVHKLKDLMDRTNRQFKIVLAGLYNVQRFQRISNQPLGHFGTIEIGPLDPKSGRDLLVQPLHALGYRFGSDPHKEDISLALHVLSFTNYHPGLIQLFGKYLIEHLKKKYQQPARPPLLITRNDIEAVYRTKEVREALRDRFILTLSCDPRYEAITLALILEQWDDKNGYDRQFSSRDLYKIAQDWWSKAFDEETISLEKFTGLLDEMCSLGVLSTNQDASSYRLRSPNLIHLIGTQEQLFTRMDTLSKTTPPGKQALDNCHARLEVESEFSPLTFAQERLLNSPHSGVVIIYGSNAMGLRNLGPALQRLLPGDAGFREIHIAAIGMAAIQQQLKQLVHEDQKSNFVIALRELNGDPDQMIDEVLGAIQYCRQVQKRVLRVCFILDPQTAWQWHQIPAIKRESVEGQVMLTMSLSRWDRIGTRQCMEMEVWEGGDIPASDRVVTKILEFSGGWPYLLNEYINRCKKKDSEQALEELKQELANPSSQISKEFISQIGIYDKLPHLVIKALKDPNIQQLMQKSMVPIEILAQELNGQNPDEIVEAVEYLKRLGIVSTEPTFTLEPVLSRNY